MPLARAAGDEPTLWRSSNRPPAGAFVVIDVDGVGNNSKGSTVISTELSTESSASVDNSISGIGKRSRAAGMEEREGGGRQMKPEDFLGNLRCGMAYNDFSLRGYELEHSRAAYIERRSRQYDPHLSLSSSSPSASSTSSCDGDERHSRRDRGVACVGAKKSVETEEVLVDEEGMVRMPLVTAMELKRGYRLMPSPDPAYLGFVPSARDERPFLSAVPLIIPGRSVTSQEEALCCSCFLPVSYVHRVALITVLVVTLLAIAALFFFVIYGMLSNTPNPIST